jgi:pimeloyl-ACP methyl ester carboxylesterase
MSNDTPPPRPKSEFRRSVVRILQLVITAYALFVLAAAIFQRRLIYFPTRLTPDQAEQIAADNGFVPWRNPSGQIIGWKLPATSSPIASVLITHGNAGCAIDRGYFAGPIHDAAPVDVYILEYPGYGSREGSPDKRSFLAAGEEAFGLLTDGQPNYLVSESIGAGVACYLARAHSTKIAGLVLFMPYHDLASVAQRKMPLLPAYLLLLDRFNPAECLRDYRGPVKIVLAGADEIIPVESGRRLFEGYPGPKNLQIIPGAHHNDIAEQSPAWWKEVFTFWQQNRPAKSGRPH